MMDSAQSLPVEDLPLLRDSFRRDWPTYAYYYNWAINAIKWRERDPKSAWSIHCPGGKYDAGAFIATALNGQYIVTVFAFEESKDKLRKMITDSNVIDWTRNVIFGFVHQSFTDVLESAIEEVKVFKNILLSPIMKDTTINYFKSRDECLKFEYQVPDNCYLRPLDVSHIPLVNSIWPHRNRENPELSEKYLETFVRLNRSVGLFLKDDNSLVSWILHADTGSLGQLQTVEGHKRKGYGRIVIQALVRELAEKESLDSTLFIVKNNAASHKLFNSLGYRPLKEVNWIKVRPSNC
ncbi:hypothetical protein QAD02_015692 [Eretmocerus hayati]|uniref:Uncharacterized protein n=1 Tax=Eretmocerus hayati TaxID=131215 RepID=A0ACC2PDR8_9HYME|nr:hypothetical protein QAD02_015692 [Eretmocerus hayati]